MSPFGPETQKEVPSTIVTAPGPAVFASVSMFQPVIITAFAAGSGEPVDHRASGSCRVPRYEAGR
jgi:hypothetical protein